MFELNADSCNVQVESSSTRASFQKNLNQKLLLKNGNSNLLHQIRNHSNRESNQELIENAAFYQIASLIPDEILSNPNDYHARRFEAVVLFADISGFTELCEKYQNLENGASKLSAVLNFYLGIMVQEILSHNGDIIKYAGDAFLAAFRNEKWMSLQHGVHNAVDTAIIIQKSCRNFRTEVGITLNVKIAISCGEVDFQIIGDENSSHYVIIGEPVWQVKSLQELISPDEILLTWKAWYYTQESFYEYQLIREHRCYKITGFKEQMSLMRRQYEASLNFQEMQKNLNKSMDARSNSNIFLESTFGRSTFISGPNEIFSLRKKIGTVTSNDVRKNLRRFIIAPLLNTINMGDDIDSMTEMRNVVIVFVNIIVPFKDSMNILSITDRLYKKIFQIVNSYEGVVNKVSLFDKDMMFLNIFGLKGLQHENESEIGLRCARELYDTLSQWKDIKTVSVGVTTGKSYCGAVGHALRREYSVISVSVNRAARLMIAYPNIVSCDQETLLASKIGLNSFELLPARKLKGINDSITVYKFCKFRYSLEYKSDLSANDVLYGRNKLLYKIGKDISNAIYEYNYQDQYEPNIKLCLMIKGESGEGKSRIINHLFVSIIKHNIKCLKLHLNTKHSTMTFWTLRSFFNKAIETDYDSKENFQNKLSMIFQRHNIHQYLYLLNEIIDINFDAEHFEAALNDEQKKELQKLMITIISKCLKNFWIFIVDDADYIDLSSLMFINSIIISQKVCFIFAIGRNHKKWFLQQGKFIKSEYVTQYNLKPIDKTFQKDIACQSINVSAIPIEFERFLHKRSNGNARWIEACAKTLLYSGKLKIETLPLKKAVNDGMIIGNLSTYHECDDFFQTKPHVQSSSHSGLIDENLIDVAIIEGVLCEKDFSDTYKNNKLLIYDSLSSFDQMICKCASVIGQKFTRTQLIYLITKSDSRQVAKTIAKLFQSSILFCASDKENELSHNICSCKNIEIFESCRDLPKYANCTYMTFNDEIFRKHVYDALTEKQRKEYYRKCINFLCRKTRRCSFCKGGEFKSIQEINIRFSDGYIVNNFNEHEKAAEVLRNVLFIQKNHCNKISRKFPIVLNFMNYEYNNCKCNFLLSHAFSDIVRHCQGKAMLMKKVFSQVVSADLSMQIGNIPNCMHLLNLSIELLHGIDLKEKSLFETYMLGRVLTLQGVCHDVIEQTKSAMDFYYDACSVFKINFPIKNNYKVYLQKINLFLKIRKILKQSKGQKLTRIQTKIVHESVFLLQNMFTCFMKNDQLEMAELSALWALKDALYSSVDLSSLALCFTNVLKSGSKVFKKSLTLVIFKEIFRTSLYENFEKASLCSLVELYSAVMEHQACIHDLPIALEIGSIAKKMCYNIGSHESLLKIIPILFTLCMKLFQIEECLKLLQELHYSIKMNNDTKEASILYHALCVDLAIATKFDEIVDYEKCLKLFIELSSSDEYSEWMLLYVVNFRLWSFQIGDQIGWNTQEFTSMEKLFSKKILNFSQKCLCVKISQVLQLELSKATKNGHYDYFQQLSELNKKCVRNLKRLKIQN